MNCFGNMAKDTMFEPSLFFPLTFIQKSYCLSFRKMLTLKFPKCSQLKIRLALSVTSGKHWK